MAVGQVVCRLSEEEIGSLRPWVENFAKFFLKLPLEYRDRFGRDYISGLLVPRGYVIDACFKVGTAG